MHSFKLTIKLIFWFHHHRSDIGLGLYWQDGLVATLGPFSVGVQTRRDIDHYYGLAVGYLPRERTFYASITADRFVEWSL